LHRLLDGQTGLKDSAHSNKFIYTKQL
jgi:hypothetical protein